MELNALELLKLTDVSKAWVDAVWEAEFCETEQLDAVIVEKITEGGTNVFKTVHTELLPFANDTTGNTQNVWILLKENDISVKTLVAVMSHFILEGKSTNSNLEERLHALQAASLYLLLLRIPGSVANQVFHQILFESSLGLIQKCWPKDSSGKKRKKDPPSNSQGKPKGRKRAKPQKKNQKKMDDDDDDEDDDEKDDDPNVDMETSFSTRELLCIRNEIESVVKTLLHLLKSGSLQHRPQCVNECVRILTELTHFEPTIEEILFSNSVTIDRMKTLPELAYHGLWILCSSRGAGDTCLRSVFRRLLFVILMMSKDDMQSKPTLLLPSHAVVAARNQAIRFVSHVVDELKDAAMPVLYILAQHICDKMVEKVDYRTKGAQAVGQLVAKMSLARRANFIRWLYSYSLKPQMAYRMFALDVVMVLLEVVEERPEHQELPLEAGQAELLTRRFLVQTLVFGRSSDVSPTVRAHALHCLSRCLDLQSQNTTRYVQELFQASAVESRNLLEMEGSEGAGTTYHGLSTFRTIQHTNANTSDESQDTIELLKQRVSDAKSSVRKAALEAITGLLKHNVIVCSKGHLTLLSERCRDSSVQVKKKAMQCLTDLLISCPDRSLVQVAWLRGVVVSVMDAETSVQEKALELLDLLILQHIKDPRHYADTAQRLAWDLLGLMCDQCADLGCYFRKAFRIWSRQKKFSTAFVNTLIKHTETEHAPVAWMLLSQVTRAAPGLDYETILNKWDNMLQMKEVRVDTTCHILSVIGDIAEHINDITRETIVEEVMGLLRSCAMPSDITHAGVEALCRLGRAEHKEVPEFQDFMNKHCGELVTICQNYLSNAVKAAEDIDTQMVVRHLYMLGKASLHCPEKVGERVFALVLSFLTTAVEIQPEGFTELPGSQPLSQFKLTHMPSVVQAHAVVTLGQLCLQHEQLAHRCLPAFARVLEEGQHMTVRSNVVVVLCDLCVRYTNMATLYVPNISACLADPVPDVREKTLIMLTNLLQEEFLKWKDSLFFRYAVVLADPVREIARLCEYCLVDRLLKKNPQMFYQHFVECIVHFNSYDKHSKYNQFPQTESERSRFSLRGQLNQGKRFKIYKFLLKNFTDEQRFNTTNRISKEILAGFVDQTLPLDEDGAALLSDTFDVLSLKELKLSAASAAEGADEPQDEQAILVKTMQKKLISHAQKKNLMENVIPIVLGLKNMLEEKRSPVLGNLMSYLQLITEDYRAELKEVFAADMQLAEELEFGLKQYQKQQGGDALEHQLQRLTFTKTTPHPATRKSRRGPRASAPSDQGFTPGRAVPSSSNPTGLPRHSEGRETSDAQLSVDTSVSAELNRNIGRAISTPQVGMHDLTFGGAFSAIRYHKSKETPQEEEKDVFHVTLGEETPRQWNIQSPLRKNPLRKIK
ncbi:condensin-2 complex subunit D3 isoform X2 [Clupea harengus]|uniref:Condensin-2 complex subunit D3 isoform X2 n=1 Tax=Clupea harengus TaxID=7950 RepID=A0A8M1K9T6_CLUHA|nr:condensin-2 complex subunit D3 isoform X2 [Clupea harengus]